MARQLAFNAERAAARKAESMETKEYRVLRDFDHGGMRRAGQRLKADPEFGERLAAEGYVREIAAAPRDPSRPPGGAETPEDRLPPATTPEDALRSEWAATRLKVSPAVYLKRSPRGPRAELAQRMVQAGYGSVVTGKG